MKKIAVIGGGWYGCHIALTLKKAGFDVTLFEAGDDIFKGISGMFGIRLHAGPHYPRSEKTRRNCQQGFFEFIETYPELVVNHEYSYYGLGNKDATGEPSKINLETFRAVGKESINSKEVNPSELGYSNLLSIVDIEEPSILVGNLLRKKFRGYLESAGVKVIYNFPVQELRKEGDKTFVIGNDSCGIFDFVVNTSSFKTLLPPPESPLPFELNIVYQPCLAVVYEDRLSKVKKSRPFSFIVMDGWYPCMMPWIDGSEEASEGIDDYRKYIVTHGSYTIMGSFPTVDEANACLKKIDEIFIKTHVQPKCETEMKRFWPHFFDTMPNSEDPRFRYVGYKAAVLAKIKTNREFRSAVTFAFEKMDVIYVVPGKVSNIFDAARETLSLINKENVLSQGDYLYVRGGALHDGVSEFAEAITVRNTCDLQTYEKLIHEETSPDSGEDPGEDFALVPDLPTFLKPHDYKSSSQQSFPVQEKVIGKTEALGIKFFDPIHKTKSREIFSQPPLPTASIENLNQAKKTTFTDYLEAANLSEPSLIHAESPGAIEPLIIESPSKRLRNF
jgi:hypothetical protein